MPNHEIIEISGGILYQDGDRAVEGLIRMAEERGRKEGDAALFAAIRQYPLSGSICTYPNGGPEAEDLHAALERLESSQKARRKIDGPSYVLWEVSLA